MSSRKGSKRKEPGTDRNPAPVVSRRRLAVALAAILIVYVALRIPGMGVPLDRDEGAFGYMGQLINKGKLPYLDGVDHKPPVAFYLNALALRWVPPTEWGVHTALLFYNLLTLVCVFFVGKVYFASLPVGLWCAFSYSVFSSSPAIQGFTASTEMWMLLPITLSLLFAVLAKRRRPSLLLFLSGVAGAAACWTKQSAFTSVLFIFLFAGMDAFSIRNDTDRERWAALFRRLSLWLMGAGIISALLMLYFYLQGVFREFIYWSFVHNWSYASSRSFGESIREVLGRLGDIIRGDFVLLGAGVAVAIVCSVRKQAGGCFMLGFLLLSFLGTIPGYGYPHYFAQLAPAVALAAGFALSSFVRQCRTRKGRLAASLACSLLVLMIPLSVNRPYYFRRDPNEISRFMFGLNPFPESKLLAGFIAANTRPEDKVLVLGSEPQILFYAGRQSPSPFLMLYPLTSSYPRYREFQEAMWKQIQSAPPPYILAVVNIPWSFLWDGRADMDFLSRIQQWTQGKYAVDRALTVTGLRGDWVIDGDHRLEQGAPCIFVLKRKG